jgi:hypothetical protein
MPYCPSLGGKPVARKPLSRDLDLLSKVGETEWGADRGNLDRCVYQPLLSLPRVQLRLGHSHILIMAKLMSSDSKVEGPTIDRIRPMLSTADSEADPALAKGQAETTEIQGDSHFYETVTAAPLNALSRTSFQLYLILLVAALNATASGFDGVCPSYQRFGGKTKLMGLGAW